MIQKTEKFYTHLLGKKMINDCTLIDGGISIDDRGHVSFVNNFNFNDVKRFYVVDNHRVGFIRAWHAHKKESKFVYVSSGTALVCSVHIDNWDNPSNDLKINKFVLSSKAPKILCIPKGFANGFKTLETNTKIFFFSSSSLEESVDDDFRYAFDFWNPWNEDYR